MSKHTPGPWRLDKFSDYSIVNNEGTKHIGVVCDKRDGPLFAAAPELLSELKHCREWHEGRVEACRLYYNNVGAIKHLEEISNITAAITKAEGAAEERPHHTYNCIQCGRERGDNHDPRCPLGKANAPAAKCFKCGGDTSDSEIVSSQPDVEICEKCFHNFNAPAAERTGE